MFTDPWFWAAAVFAVVMMGLAKGGLAGTGVLATPVLALAISPVEAASILLPILIVQDVFSVWAFRRRWDGKSVALLLPGAAVGIFVAYSLAAYVSVAAVGFSIGVVSIAFGLWRLYADRMVQKRGSDAPSWTGVFWGAIGGFTSHIMHAGAPPVQIYLMPRRLPHQVYVGTMAIVFAAINWMKVPAYVALGQFGSDTLLMAAALLPLAVGSTLAGVWVTKRLSADRFYTIAYIMLIAIGAKFLWDGIGNLW